MTNAAIIAALTAEGSEFARSLADSLRKYGTLSPKQEYWVKRLIAPKPEVDSLDFSKVVALVDRARAKGAKRIALTFGSVEVKFATGGRNAGGLWVTDGLPFGQNRLYGSVSAGATALVLRREAAAVIEALRKVAADPQAAAVQHGRVSGCCCFCSRPLTDAGSVEHGYGPTCAEKYGLPWASKSQAQFTRELATA